jgi:hypothetical protein
VSGGRGGFGYRHLKIFTFHLPASQEVPLFLHNLPALSVADDSCPTCVATIREGRVGSVEGMPEHVVIEISAFPTARSLCVRGHFVLQ